MDDTLTDIAQELKDNNKKVQLIYAFNGTGKTRLSREFKLLVVPKVDDTELEGYDIVSKKILYYNAFTEDLFYWDNDLEFGVEPKLKIHSNLFTEWIFNEQGQDRNVIDIFQHYTDEKLSPNFNSDFSELTFSYKRGNEDLSENIKISKGEESCFIWSIFYSLLEQVVNVLNVADKSERETNQFDQLEYIFIDDPVSSLDDNHLIELAVNLSKLIKDSESNLEFIITTHNPLFYNVLYNEFSNQNKETGYKPNKHFSNYCLIKNEDLSYELNKSKDSPFSYHLFLLNEIKMAIETGQIYKYHFNFLRNILEKTATFLGYKGWGDLLSPIEGEREVYIKRILNLSSHSKHSAEEIIIMTEDDKRVLKYIFNNILEVYRFNRIENTNSKEE